MAVAIAQLKVIVPYYCVHVYSNISASCVLAHLING